MAIAKDSYHASSNPVASKPLGQYLVEAGLLNDAQVRVALTDQQTTGMLFGEVIVARGWMKEQTVEYLIQKVVVPERKRLEAQRIQAQQKRQPQPSRQTQPHLTDPVTTSQDLTQQVPLTEDAGQSGFKRKDPPIAKPLPSVNSVDSDVSWVG